MTDAPQPPSGTPLHGDRRALPRDTTLRAAEVAAPGASFSARVVDISPNGLQLRAARPLAAGQQIEVEVQPRPEDPKGRVYLVRGIVVRCLPQADGYALGIRLATHLGEAEDYLGPRLVAFAEAEAAVRGVSAMLRQLGGDAASPIAYAAHRASEAADTAPPTKSRRRRYAMALVLLLALLLALVWTLRPVDKRTARAGGALGSLAHSAETLPPSLLVDTLLQAIEAEDPDAIQTTADRLREHHDSTATQRLIGTLGGATTNDPEVPAKIVAALPGSAPEWQRLAQTYLHTRANATPGKAQPLAPFQTVAWFDDAIMPAAATTPAEPTADPQIPAPSASTPAPAAPPEAAPPSEPIGETAPPAATADIMDGSPQQGGMGGPLLPVPEGDPTPAEVPAPNADPDPLPPAPKTPTESPAQAEKKSPPLPESGAAPLRLEVDTGTFVLTIFRGEEALRRFPVGLGRNASTPTGTFRIANKLVNPAWYNRGNVVASGDPANPIGAYWMGLGRDGKATSYGIHPTQDPEAIGAEKSRGCIRMRPADAAALFDLVPLGTRVIIR